MALPQGNPAEPSFRAQSHMKADWGRFGGGEKQIFMTCDNRQIYVCAPELWAFLEHLPAVPSASPGKCQSPGFKEFKDSRNPALHPLPLLKVKRFTWHLARCFAAGASMGKQFSQENPLSVFQISICLLYYRHRVVTDFFSSLLLQKVTRLNQLQQPLTHSK